MKAIAIFPSRVRGFYLLDIKKKKKTKQLLLLVGYTKLNVSNYPSDKITVSGRIQNRAKLLSGVEGPKTTRGENNPVEVSFNFSQTSACSLSRLVSNNEVYVRFNLI